ncbi:hypothetical protein Tco_0598441 [Tanacetum coccineum]
MMRSIEGGIPMGQCPEVPQTPPVPQDEDEHEPMFVQAHDTELRARPIFTLSILHHWRMCMRFPAEARRHYLPEYEDDEIEDGLVDYPIDGGDDGDGDDSDSSRDDTNDEDEDDEDEEEEEEEHLAPADSAIDYHRPQASYSLPPEAEVERLTGLTTLPSQHHLSHYHHPCRGSALLSPARKRLYLSTLGSKYEVGESSTARPTRGQGIDYGFVSTVDAEERRQGIRGVGYGIRGTWVDPAEAVPEIAPMTVGEVNTRVIELAELHEHDTQDLYALLEDAQDSRSRISHRVDMDSQRVDLLMGDRMTFQETATHQELQTHRDHVYAHETHLQAHQTHLQLQSTLIQTQHQVELLTLQEQQRRARQPGPETRIPDHQDASGDADSHI